MKKSPILLAVFLPAWALGQTQSPIEPPRRAVPPAATANAGSATGTPAPAAPPAAPGVVLPDSANKPPVATGLPPSVQEKIRQRAEAAKKAAEENAAKLATGDAPAIPTAPATTGATTPGTAGAASPAAAPRVVTPAPATRPPASPGDPSIPAELRERFARPNSTANPNAGLPADPEAKAQLIDDPNATLDTILSEYERLTKKTVVRASNILGGGGGPGPQGGGGGGGGGAVIPMVANPAKELNNREYLELIRASLMVNGYSIHEYSENLHIITFNGAPSPLFPSTPGLQGHPVYMREVDLPDTDQFVNYFMKFEHIPVQDAVTILGQPPHQSGKIVAVPNALGVLITESVPVVRSLIAIQKKIDVVNGVEMINKFVQLKLADAEEVAQSIQQVLQQQSQNKSGQGGAATPTRLIAAPNAAQQLTNTLQQGGQPGQPNQGQAAPDATSVVVQPDRRTGRILLSGMRKDVEYIEKLIQEFDKPSVLNNLLTYQLRYLPVNDFLGLAQDSLEARGFGTSQGGASGGTRSTTGSTGVSPNQDARNSFQERMQSGSSSSRSSSRSGSSAFGGSTGSSFGGGGGFGGGGSFGGGSRSGGSSAGLSAPESVTVGKILLVSNPQNNSLVVSGPPEGLEQIRKLIEQLDRRPMQVFIDCIVAEVTLSNDLNWGLDILRTVDNANVGGQSVDFASIFRSTGTSNGIIDPIALNTVNAFNNIGSPAGINTYMQVGELVTAYAKAAESTGKVRVLQKPSVATANNEPAYIAIGREVPYSSGTNSGTNTNGSFNTYTDFKEVLLSLDVTPLINSKNEVTLTIQQTNDNVIGNSSIGGNPVPILGRQSLNTKLTVPNQGIAVIGGLVADSRDTSNNGTPLLARIPVIKHIFGSTTKKDSRRELIIFIQPRIMETGDEMVSVNNMEVQRTMLGKEAEEFARPKLEPEGVTLPTEAGDIPFEDAGYPPGQEPSRGFWKRLFGSEPKAAPAPQAPAPAATPNYPRTVK